MQGVENEPVQNPALQSGTEVRSDNSNQCVQHTKWALCLMNNLRRMQLMSTLLAIGAKQHTPVVKKPTHPPLLQV